MALAPRSRRRHLSLGSEVHLCEKSAVLRRHAARAAPRGRRDRRADPRDIRRQHHDRPHFARGSIKADGPAGKYLQAHGVPLRSSTLWRAARQPRGDDARHVRERADPEPDGGGSRRGVTLHQPSGDQLSIFDAAMLYAEQATPLVVLAGKEYGSGSSRDWAAKGPALLGVRAVVAESYERIHRSNLVGMGVLPLRFLAGQSAESLGLRGTKRSTSWASRTGSPRDSPRGASSWSGSIARIRAERVQARVRIDTPREIEIFPARRNPSLRTSSTLARWTPLMSRSEVSCGCDNPLGTFRRGVRQKLCETRRRL